MPVLSYQPWKAAKVESGECHQTIRRIRKRPIEVGQILYHWQQQCIAGTSAASQRRKLGESVCTAVIPFAIAHGHFILGGELLDFEQATELAIADGFNTLENFVKFFEGGYGLPFDGVVIQWGELTKPIAEPAAMGAGQVQLVIVEVV